MDKEDMRRLISYGNVYSKDTKKRLSEITVEECLNFMEFKIWNRRIYALPVLDCNRFLILPK
jgi:hypothetical protein